MKPFLTFGIYLQIFALVSAKLNLKFFEEIFSHYSFHSSIYNVKICKEQEGIDLIKTLSQRFQKFVSAYELEIPSLLLNEPQTLILDLQCPDARRILEQADKLGLFNSPFEWLLLSESAISAVFHNTGNTSTESRESWFWSFLETLNILTDSDVKVIEESPDQKLLVTGAYILKNSLIKEPLFKWSFKEGLIAFNFKSTTIRRWNLQGAVIPSSFVITSEDSLNHMESLVGKHEDTTSKISYNMIKLFDDLFNTSIIYKIEKEWGVFENGSWTGMVGDFEKKEIELGASPLFLQAERMNILEYYACVTPTRVKFIFLSPPLSYSSNIFAMPFDRIVWYCCLGMVAISCFLLYAALNYEKSAFEVGGKNHGSNISFSEILVLNIGAICLQGTVAETKNPPGRIITLFLYLSYMFLYISYSASIVAILQSSDTSIQTLSDFLESPLKAGAEDVAYSQYYFKVADDDVRRAIYQTKIAPKNEPPHFLAVEDGIREVKKGFYGFHVEVNVGYQVVQKTFTEEEKCALQELKESFFKFSDPWLAMKKKSPYAELFKIGMKMCIERGFKSRFVHRFYTKKPVCSSKSSRFVSVGIFDCYYAFMLLTSGWITAIIILVFEISFDKYLKRRKKHRLRFRGDFVPGLKFIS